MSCRKEEDKLMVRNEAGERLLDSRPFLLQKSGQQQNWKLYRDEMNIVREPIFSKFLSFCLSFHFQHNITLFPTIGLFVIGQKLHA